MHLRKCQLTPSSPPRRRGRSIDEYAIAKQHPERGRELLIELGGAQLDTATRILAVCDVYDALVSPRPYRPAWSREQALSLLRDESSVSFDIRCVDALEHIVGGAARPDDSRVELTVASPAWSAP